MGYGEMSKEMLIKNLMEKDNIIKELGQENQKLKHIANVDGMTGVLNKKAGLDYLERKFKLSKRNNKGLVICFIDVDGLKIINDTFGHGEGDKLLISVSQILKNGLRKTDFVTRMGGDEFLIVFPETTMKEANKIWGRILNLVEKVNYGKEKYKMEFSYGFYEYIKNSEENTSAEEMVRSADIQMYKMKREKRRI